jgi:hypothetical protein
LLLDAFPMKTGAAVETVPNKVRRPHRVLPHEVVPVRPEHFDHQPCDAVTVGVSRSAKLRILGPLLRSLLTFSVTSRSSSELLNRPHVNRRLPRSRRVARSNSRRACLAFSSAFSLVVSLLGGLPICAFGLDCWSIYARQTHSCLHTTSPVAKSH